MVGAFSLINYEFVLLMAAWDYKVVQSCASAYLVAVKHFLPTLTLLLVRAGPSLAASPRPAASVAAAPVRPPATVYVCLSKTSYAYHSSEACSGLNRCAHPIKPMPTAEAEKLGKRACHRC